MEIRFGAMAPKLKVQLYQIENRLSDEQIEHYQKDADAITRLRIRGLLNHSETAKAEKRLVKKLEQNFV